MMMIPSPTRTIFDEIATFLATNPTPQAILDYRLPAELEARAHELLARHNEGLLTYDEQHELFDFMRADEMMTSLKAKTRLKLLGKD